MPRTIEIKRILLESHSDGRETWIDAANPEQAKQLLEDYHKAQKALQTVIELTECYRNDGRMVIICQEAKKGLS